MKLLSLLCLAVIFLSGCASTYQQTNRVKSTTTLDPKKAVVVSTPQDGRFEADIYRNSGIMTSRAVQSAFERHADKVRLIEDCYGADCLDQINSAEYGYYVAPKILHWEERATEWSGRPDRIEIRLVIYDTATKEIIADGTYSGVSKWATMGGDHPQDLLPEPTNAYVNGLY